MAARLLAARLLGWSLVVLAVPALAVRPDGGGAWDALLRYLRVDTAQPAPDYTSAADFLVREARALGLEADLFEVAPGKPVVVATLRGSDPSARSVLLNSHMDVVPADAARWSRPPFAAEVDPATGEVYARGAQDMKCVGVQHLYAMGALAAAVAAGERPPLRRDVHATLVPEEEVGGALGMSLLVGTGRFRALDPGVALDEGWATPGEEFAGFYAERHVWWLELEAHGEPAHGARLVEGTAMENMQAALSRVYAWRAAQAEKVRRGEALEGEVVGINLVYLRGGVVRDGSAAYDDASFLMNVQPGHALAGFDMRVPPWTDRAELEALVAGNWAPRELNLTHRFVIQDWRRAPGGSPPVTDTAGPWWRLLAETLRSSLGAALVPDVFPAATDSRYLRELGIPVIGFSPMRNTRRLLHEHDERLARGVFLEGLEALVGVVQAFADAGSSFDGEEGEQAPPPPRGRGPKGDAGRGTHEEL